MDGRTDIYALGCVLYEMLAGEPPYTGPTAQAIIAKRMLEPVPRIRTIRETVPEELERAITRALAKAPADRFAHGAGVRGRALPIGERAAGSSRRWHASASANRGDAGRRPRGGRDRVSPLVRDIPSADISPSASLIAVLPFTPSGSDTALSRLGRDLVFTLSAELDGLGAIRVVDAHTVLAQAKPG